MIASLIKSIGVKTFIKYFEEFNSLYNGQITKQQLMLLFERNKETWNLDSQSTKISKSLLIIKTGRALEAICYILRTCNPNKIEDGMATLAMAQKIKNDLQSMDLEDESFYSTTETPKYLEGAKKVIYVNKYERNREARAECIKFYGPKCRVCELNFEEKYGAIGLDSFMSIILMKLVVLGKTMLLTPP